MQAVHIEGSAEDQRMTRHAFKGQRSSEGRGQGLTTSSASSTVKTRLAHHMAALKASEGE